MLWNRCVDTNEKILILEHDTIFTSEFKDYDYEGVLNYGKPLWDSREKRGERLVVEFCLMYGVVPRLS